jgi:hypothetical protein
MVDRGPQRVLLRLLVRRKFPHLYEDVVNRKTHHVDEGVEIPMTGGRSKTMEVTKETVEEDVTWILSQSPLFYYFTKKSKP